MTDASLPRPDWVERNTIATPPPEVAYPEEHWDWNAWCCRPEIDPTAWVAPGAIVLGRVRLAARSSVWYGCILRGDQEYIEVGEETNIQDGSILHIDVKHPCILGKRVTLGHQAIVHGSIVEDDALIGIAARILSRCVIGKGALIAAGAVVLEGTHVPPHTLWAGCPARQIKELTPEQQARLGRTFRHYVNNAAAARAYHGGQTPLPRPADLVDPQLSLAELIPPPDQA